MYSFPLLFINPHTMSLVYLANLVYQTAALTVTLSYRMPLKLGAVLPASSLHRQFKSLQPQCNHSNDLWDILELFFIFFYPSLHINILHSFFILGNSGNSPCTQVWETLGWKKITKDDYLTLGGWTSWSLEVLSSPMFLWHFGTLSNEALKYVLLLLGDFKKATHKHMNTYTLLLSPPSIHFLKFPLCWLAWKSYIISLASFLL